MTPRNFSGGGPPNEQGSRKGNNVKEKGKRQVRLLINGQWMEREVPSDLILSHFLRNELHMTGTKDGCSQGHCGACTVIIDGKAANACLQKVSRLDGKRIETIESLAAPGGLHPIQEAFLSTAGVQCGFCTSGMIMATKALLDKNPSPSSAEIMKGLKGNLCRCTGYVKILDAVNMASDLLTGRGTPQSIPGSPSPDGKYLGASLPDVDGLLKVRGELKFAADMFLEGMGYGKILWSTHPHAEILSIDTSRAEAMDGVRAVLTAKDIPGKNGFGDFGGDQPVLADKKVRFLGDPVALVVADSEAVAMEACKAIAVEYRKLKVVSSPQEALRPGAPLVHERGNIMRQLRHRVGDVEKAFAEADLIVERDYSTPFIDHAFLEPESGVAAPSEDGKISIWSPTQRPFEIRTQIAKVLGVPEEKIRVIATPVGGAFGGKDSITTQALLGLAALRTRRPVKIQLTREESLRYHTKKHASCLHYKTGFTREGKMIAHQAKILMDTGPYTDLGPIVLDQASIFSGGPYEIPNVDLEGMAVFTNNANGGAMRGFGLTQVAFAIESQLDIAARQLNVDPFELRLINGLEIGKSMISGEVLRASVSIKETIRAARQSLPALASSPPGKRVGIGVASVVKNVGAGKGLVDDGGAIIQLTGEGRIRANISTVDMGQGNRTAMVQLVAHELGIGSDRVEIVTGDTDLVPKAWGVFGARATYCSGNAAIVASREFKKRLLEWTSGEFRVPGAELDVGAHGIIRTNNGSRPIATYEEIGRRLADRGEEIRAEYTYIAPKTFPISFQGLSASRPERSEPPKIEINKEEYRNYPAYTYITSVAMVEVDESTGEVAVKKVISAVDVGKVINLQKIEGQIEGSVLMAMGYALSESYDLKNGIPVTKNLKKCRIPTIDQTPEIVTLIIEDPDPNGPYGAKGISEVAAAPVTPAVINAIYDAVGVRIYDLPGTKKKILAQLRGAGSGVLEQGVPH